VAIPAVALLCTACATSTPVRSSEGTYMVSALAPSSGGTDAKQQALEQASSFCAARGATVRVVSSDAHECALHGGCGEARVTFACASAAKSD
jgi:hypothetical protein